MLGLRLPKRRPIRYRAVLHDLRRSPRHNCGRFVRNGLYFHEKSCFNPQSFLPSTDSAVGGFGIHFKDHG